MGRRHCAACIQNRVGCYIARGGLYISRGHACIYPHTYLLEPRTCTISSAPGGGSRSSPSSPSAPPMRPRASETGHDCARMLQIYVSRGETCAQQRQLALCTFDKRASLGPSGSVCVGVSEGRVWCTSVWSVLEEKWESQNTSGLAIGIARVCVFRATKELAGWWASDGIHKYVSYG